MPDKSEKKCPTKAISPSKPERADWLNFSWPNVLTGVARFSPSFLRRHSTGVSRGSGIDNPELSTQTSRSLFQEVEFNKAKERLDSSIDV